MTDVPANANDACPGTGSANAGKSSSCAGCPNQRACSTGEKVIDPAIALIRDRFKRVKHKILIMSGKGGVGKSTLTTNLAYALAANEEIQVGVLDIDLCGPSQARMFGVEEQSVHKSAEGWIPAYPLENLAVMSAALVTESRDQALIMRGPRKYVIIKQFLSEVDWDEIDYMLIDTPPGTSDEHINIVQLLLEASDIDGAIIITTPQEVSLLDVRKEINFCVKTKVPILGVVENMSQFICPHCKHDSQLFPSTTGGATQMCQQLNLPLLAKLAHDPNLAQSCDNGEQYRQLFEQSPVAQEFAKLAKFVLKIATKP